MHLRTYGSFKSANKKKIGPHLRKVRKSNNLFISETLRNLFAAYLCINI
jgi:hypothetical protein